MFQISTTIHFIQRGETHASEAKTEDRSLSSVCGRGPVARYVIAGDDCDRVYLALQNRFICDSLQTPGRITNRTYRYG